MPETTSTLQAGEGIPLAQRRAAMAAVLMSVGMATLDTAIANTALPTMARDLGADASASIWIVSAYQLAVIAALLPFASLADTIGHRRVYMWGISVFTLASLLCGVAWSLPLLAGARLLQGLGGAGIMSANLALIRFIYPTNLLGRGAGLNALAVAVCFTIGPSVASLILSVASWHWLFLINVPIGVASMLLSQRFLPSTQRGGARFDGRAALLSAAMFTLLILGIDAIGHGSPWPTIVAELASGSVCCALLLRRQAGHAAPMLAVDLFRIPVFALSSLTSICSFTTQGLAFVALPFLFQHGMGRSQVAAGFLMTPWPAVVGVMAPLAGRLSDRYPTGILGGIGLALLAIGMALVAILPAEPSTLDIVWRMMLCGAGFGFFQSPNLRAMMSSAPARRAGGASGVVATSRQFGQTSGAAMVALCFGLSAVDGPRLALWLGCGFAGLGTIVSLLRLAAPKPGAKP
jgi:DHA2 family multidrug resistance protein-like MFS transporter